jgi:hypothetical protein
VSVESTSGKCGRCVVLIVDVGHGYRFEFLSTDTGLYMGLIRNTPLQFKMLETSLLSCHSVKSKWTSHLDLQKINNMYTINPLYILHPRVLYTLAYLPLARLIPHRTARVSMHIADRRRRTPPTHCMYGGAHGPRERPISSAGPPR